MPCSSARRGRPGGPPPPLRASIWAVTVTGDQPPPTRCPAPSQSSPSELFWLALSPTAGGSRQKSPKPECAQRDLSVLLGAAGPHRQTRDRRGGMRLARRLGPAAVAGRPRRDTQWENEPLRSPGVRWAIRA